MWGGSPHPSSSASSSSPPPLTQTHSDMSPRAEICIVETAAKGTACRGEEGGGGVCVCRGGNQHFFFGGGMLAVHPLAKS